MFGSDLPDDAFAGVFDQPRPRKWQGAGFVKFLLDTNVISEIRKRERAHPNVARWVEQTPPREMG